MTNNETILLDLAPVGVRILKETDPVPAQLPQYEGVSYCQAVLQSTFGKEQLVIPGSIKVCQWAPVVLGFKKAENEFEHSIKPHLPPGTKALHLAPITAFKKNQPPDVVIIRTRAEVYRTIIKILGNQAFIPYQDTRLDETALSIFFEGPLKGFSRLAIRNINRWLSWMNRFGWWQGFTTFLFRSTTITRWFDRFITRYMANMSICRNSTVIPLQTGRANISFFCTGGIAWGKNFHDFMTSGFPYALYRKFEERLVFPGRPDVDYQSRISKRLREAIPKTEPQAKGSK